MEICSRRYRPGPLVEYGLIYGMLEILILISARLLPLSRIPFLCPFKSITGIPCPTCGSIRAFMHLAHLDIVGAFGMNPLISASMIIGAIFFLYSTASFFFKPLRFEVRFDRSKKITLRLGAILVITLNWIYLIIAGI